MKTWNEAEIKNLILTNDRMVMHSVKQLYDRQTAGEQTSHETTVRNGAGFNAFDAPFLSSCAEWYNRSGYLSRKQIALCRKKLVKYVKQLTAIANEK